MIHPPSMAAGNVERHGGCSGDPMLNGAIAPATSATIDVITRQVGWNMDARYETLPCDVNRTRPTTVERDLCAYVGSLSNARMPGGNRTHGCLRLS